MGGKDGQGGQLPTHVLSYQMTLSQLEGTYCAPNINTCPPSFMQLPASPKLNCNITVLNFPAIQSTTSNFTVRLVYKYNAVRYLNQSGLHIKTPANFKNFFSPLLNSFFGNKNWRALLQFANQHEIIKNYFVCQGNFCNFANLKNDAKAHLGAIIFAMMLWGVTCCQKVQLYGT